MSVGMAFRIAAAAASFAAFGGLAGCQVFGLAGAVSAQLERSKQIEVLAEYDGLRNRSVAVVVQ